MENENGQEPQQTQNNMVNNPNAKSNEEIQTNTKRKRNNQEDTELIEQLYKLLSEEKERSNLLVNEIIEMRKQLSNLTQSVSDLNELVKNLQAEKKELIEKLNKKKPNKKDEKNEQKSTTSNENTNTTKAINEKNKSQTNTNAMDTSTHEQPEDDTEVPRTGNINNTSLDQYATILREQITSTDKDNSQAISDSHVTNHVTHHMTNEQEDSEKKETCEENKETHEFGENDKINRNNRTPPIDIWTENQLATQLVITRNIPKHSCVFSKINKTKMRIIPRTSDVRTKVLDYLNTQQIKYNTYTPADEKMQNILLKGTEINSSAVIEETLIRNGITPHRIQRLETGYMRKNNIKSNIWQIVLLPKTDMKEVTKIRYIAEWSVKWEIMRKPPITQCRRCQRFNHSASNCTLQYRCVKCPETHKPGDCPLDKSNNKTKPYCVNCKGEHTANNAKMCPTFQKEIKIRETKKDTSAKKKTNQTNDNEKPSSSTTNPKPTQQQKPQATNYSSIVKQKTTPNEKQNAESNDIIQIIKENQQSMREMFEKMFEDQSKLVQAFLSENNVRNK